MYKSTWKQDLIKDAQSKSFQKKLLIFVTIITVSLTINTIGNRFIAENQITKKESIRMFATVYAYSSEKRQTDSTPHITASNQKVRDGIVANNCLPFGTLVKIADRIFEVQDKMNKRYDCTVFDVWHESTKEAWKFGKQLLEVEIIK